MEEDYSLMYHHPNKCKFAALPLGWIRHECDLMAVSKWFYDTSTEAAPEAARCGSSMWKPFSLLFISSR
jgi:hypothetical protein